MANLDSRQLEALKADLNRRAHVALHLHPDRRTPRGEKVCEGLLRSGRYHGQFVTGVSNGGLSPELGGPRDRWEQQLFAGTYRDAPPESRPKYGALALMGYADGPAPRFGCCYLLLHPTCSQTCTFTYGDSCEQPDHRGTWGCWDDILAAMFGDAFSREAALGTTGLRPPALIKRLLAQLSPASRVAPGQGPLSHNLDHYVEAQVHGDIELARDVQALVADPAFRDTETGDTLKHLCATYGIELCWHPGYVLAPADVPPDFRGPSMPALARELAGGQQLDAAMIGKAANADPARYQLLKLLWHVLVRYGKPRRAKTIETGS